MIGKVGTLGLGLATLFALNMAAGSNAFAGGTLDASQYTVKCDTLTKGSIGFAPALTNSGGGPGIVKIKGALSGCTATPVPGGTPITSLSGSISGLLNSATSTCSGLIGPSASTGTITIKWKAVPALILPTTTITIGAGNTSGGIAQPFAPGNLASYGSFTISGATVAGSFLGADNGATSFSNTLTTQDVGALAAACGGLGLKAVSIGASSIALQ